MINFCEAGRNFFSSREGLKRIHMDFMCKGLQLLHIHLDLCQCHPCAGECKSYALLLGIVSIRSLFHSFTFSASRLSQLPAIVAGKPPSKRKHFPSSQTGYMSKILWYRCSALGRLALLAFVISSVKTSCILDLHPATKTSVIPSLTICKNSRMRFWIALASQ